MPERPPPELLEACKEAHRRLFSRLEAADEATVRRASLLPGWSVAHVLTHLARNADSFVRQLEAAADGRRVMQYDGGAEGRSAEIEDGARRGADDIVADVRGSSTALEEAFDAASPQAWEGGGLTTGGEPAPCSRFPLRRLREVEVHHVDLGLGYSPSDWPEDFVALTLKEVLEGLPRRITVPAQRAQLLAWATGRSSWPERIDLSPW